MSRHAPGAVLSLLIVLFAPPAFGQCSSTGTFGSGPDYVYLQNHISMTMQSSSSVGQGVAAWRGCYSPGSSFGFPIPTTNPVSGASFASITVRFVTGYHPTILILHRNRDGPLIYPAEPPVGLDLSGTISSSRSA